MYNQRLLSWRQSQNWKLYHSDKKKEKEKKVVKESVKNASAKYQKGSFESFFSKSGSSSGSADHDPAQVLRKSAKVVADWL